MATPKSFRDKVAGIAFLVIMFIFALALINPSFRALITKPFSRTPAPASAQLAYHAPRTDFSAQLTKAKSAASDAKIAFAEDGGDSAVQAVEDIDFIAGNSHFKQGQYQAALDKYKSVLTKIPYHYGALNNAALACLELNQSEKALQYALTAIELYPTDQELYLNAQAACVAAGYSLDELSTAYANYPGHMVHVDEIDRSVENAFLYNEQYAGIERNEIVSPSRSTVTSSSKTDPRQSYYTGVMRVLQDLHGADAQDRDVSALMAYFQKTGVQAGVVSKPKVSK